MSHKEALEDKIPFKILRNRFNAYYPPCCVCGQPVYSWNYIRGLNYSCRECRKKKAKKVSTEKSVHTSSH